MQQQYTPIKDITPQSRAWMAKVRVAEKCMPRIAQNSSKRFQRLVLMDDEVMSVFLLDLFVT